MKKTNISTTRNIKDGVPAKYARKWTSNSNVPKNILRTWADSQAAHQRKAAAAAAATATVVSPAMTDGVGDPMMENGLRYRERKLTYL